MTRAIETDRVEHLEVAPGALWARLEAVEEYPTWWPWLAAFDGRALRAGEVWAATVSPRLPWRLRVTVTLEEVVAGASVRARLAGDITGPAHLALRPAGGGTDLHLTARLAPASAPLRALTALARPVAQRSHDHVIDRGLDQLRDRVGRWDRMGG